jgi:tRNA pseudouridine55 synthase
MEASRPMRSFDFEAGEVFLVNKPKGWSSFDVVRKLRSLFRLRKVGHAGTLDPMASGLLILCTGRKTKEIQTFQALEKEYEGIMELGARTRSFDAETEVFEHRSLDGITSENVRVLFREFVGESLQSPPVYSAVKVRGRRLYKYARKGRTVDLPRRKVRVFEFEPTEIRIPEVHFRLRCSKGTYVRALVEDFGQRLGCGAYLKALTRTKIGTYRLEDALSIEAYEALAERN